MTAFAVSSSESICSNWAKAAASNVAVAIKNASFYKKAGPQMALLPFFTYAVTVTVKVAVVPSLIITVNVFVPAV
jgi:hypothetical protein